MEDLLGGDLKAQRRKASGEAASPSPGPATQENNGTSSSSVISETEYFLFHKVSVPKPTTQHNKFPFFFFFSQFSLSKTDRMTHHHHAAGVQVRHAGRHSDQIQR